MIVERPRDRLKIGWNDPANLEHVGVGVHQVGRGLAAGQVHGRPPMRACRARNERQGQCRLPTSYDPFDLELDPGPLREGRICVFTVVSRRSPCRVVAAAETSEAASA